MSDSQKGPAVIPEYTLLSDQFINELRMKACLYLTRHSQWVMAQVSNVSAEEYEAAEAAYDDIKDEWENFGAPEVILALLERLRKAEGKQ